MVRFIRQAFLQLWTEAPALRAAFAYSLGALFALKTVWAFPLFVLLLCTQKSCMIPRMTLLFMLPLCVIRLPEKVEEGPGIFIVDAITPSRSHFKTGLCHRGRWSFDDKEKGRNIPCFVFSNQELSSFSARGILDPNFHLKTFDQTPLNRFSLLSYRLKAKKMVHHYIKKRIKDRDAATFLAAIFTGEMDDKMMHHDFSLLGLTHLLAISGLHFGLLALFFKGALFFLPNKVSHLLQILLLTLYFLFLGSSPSIQRAYIFIMINLIGKVIGRRGNSLNTVGASLLIAAIINPFSLKTLSLQLTFLATLGILLFYRPRNPPLQEIVQHSSIYQVGIIVFTLLKKSASLTFAVFLAIFPLQLYIFHSFYPHAFFYNLIFPFLMSLSLLLLLLGFLLPPIHLLNTHYTTAILRVVENPPLKLPGIFVEEVSPFFVALYLLTLFVVAVCRKEAQRRFSDHRWCPQIAWQVLFQKTLFLPRFLRPSPTFVQQMRALWRQRKKVFRSKSQV